MMSGFGTEYGFIGETPGAKLSRFVAIWSDGTAAAAWLFEHGDRPLAPLAEATLQASEIISTLETWGDIDAVVLNAIPGVVAHPVAVLLQKYRVHILAEVAPIEGLGVAMQKMQSGKLTLDRYPRRATIQERLKRAPAAIDALTQGFLLGVAREPGTGPRMSSSVAQWG
ncbi:hypothetical protein ACQ4N7_30015 [Nodosilinea sp. AN01ver1]|uniref:hypothetical protein n=1 Tax=Nodosilinea sp. AN01ver1 TaxID=3423362 RepID=UPI003D319712